jgi:hypothetical protein
MFNVLWSSFVKTLPPVLLVVFAACVVGAVVSYISKTEWWERHVAAEFPYEHECFNCQKTTCEGCSVAAGETPVLFYEE